MRSIPEKSTPIINEIIEALAKARLSTYEFNVIFAIIRKTYGWDQKDDWIAGTQFHELTNIPISHISRTLKKLIGKKIVLKNGKRIGINKKTNEWNLPIQVILPKQVNLPKQVSKVTQTGNKNLPKQVNTKETIKETITKETIPKGITAGLLPSQKKEIRKEIDNMLIALKTSVMIDDFADSQRWQRIYGKHCLSLFKKLGKDEFVRRLEALKQDAFHSKNLNKIKYIYNNIKGFIEPKTINPTNYSF